MSGSKRRMAMRRGPNPIDYGDLPREELMRRAHIACRIGWDVRFKFTCGACGTRCAFADLNRLSTDGECSSCGRSTTVVRGGFMLLAVRPTETMMTWATLPEKIRFRVDPGSV
jgi:hypothetical protein